ncbi:MAG: hypothetical protein HKP45_03975 [Winogradskyella sp.]|nr:hypothetical protein [Winogradskyella sp.]NNK39797.1 hypothetical protein [Winogradskyella sp.]NNL83986.1 hypothetical protein [Winogradskyella sp.]
MKLFNVKRLLLLTTIILGSSLLQAQEKKMYQMYEVHEDQVKPSMVAQYEKTAKMFADKMREHNITDGGYLTVMTDDFRYMFVNPIDSLGQATPGMQELWEKMGADAFSEMMSGFDPCYDRHGNYVIVMDKELTYMPEGITTTPEGENYRKFYFIYYSPQNSTSVRDAMKDIKDLFAKKGSKSYYRVYRSGYGTMDSYYMVAVAAKDAMTAAQNAAENDKLLGQEAEPIFSKLMSVTLKMEEKSGSVRPDLSYTASNNN